MKISKHIKIGITSQCEENLFGNGLKSNVWFLHQLLKKAGYDVHMVSESDKHFGKKLLGVEIKKLDTVSVLDYNILIQCANSLSEPVRLIHILNSGHSFVSLLIILLTGMNTFSEA